MGKFKTKPVTREAQFNQALCFAIPKYIANGTIKQGDWCAVLVMDEGGGRLSAAVIPAADQEEARLRRRQFQSLGEGRQDYVGSMSLQVK